MCGIMYGSLPLLLSALSFKMNVSTNPRAHQLSQGAPGILRPLIFYAQYVLGMHDHAWLLHGCQRLELSSSCLHRFTKLTHLPLLNTKKLGVLIIVNDRLLW